jgi:light-harvesting complex I chlorophyll a/b binding protein 1
MNNSKFNPNTKSVGQTRRNTQVNSSLGNWLPGSVTPSYLNNITGSYGFDPLGLGSTPSNLARFQEAELIHCRWAMLGAAGALSVEALGFGNWYDAALAAKQTYFGVEMPFDLNTLVGIEFIVMAAVEARRFDETDINKRL